MRRLSILAGCALALVTATAHAEPNASGVWARGDGNARVKIAPCGGKVCATNLWIKDTSKGENVGDQLVMDVKASGANTLKGSAYDVKRKRSYSISMKVSGARLTTRGCIAGGILCKSVNWSKVGG